MAEFICLGERWVNVDKIISVKMERGNNDELIRAHLQYGPKAFLQFTGEDAQTLMQYLKDHKSQ